MKHTTAPQTRQDSTAPAETSLHELAECGVVPGSYARRRGIDGGRPELSNAQLVCAVEGVTRHARPERDAANPQRWHKRQWSANDAATMAELRARALTQQVIDALQDPRTAEHPLHADDPASSAELGELPPWLLAWRRMVKRRTRTGGTVERDEAAIPRKAWPLFRLVWLAFAHRTPGLYVSQASLAARLEVTPRTIERWGNELEAVGAIRKVRTVEPHPTDKRGRKNGILLLQIGPALWEKFGLALLAYLPVPAALAVSPARCKWEAQQALWAYRENLFARTGENIEADARAPMAPRTPRAARRRAASSDGDNVSAGASRGSPPGAAPSPELGDGGELAPPEVTGGAGQDAPADAPKAPPRSRTDILSEPTPVVEFLNPCMQLAPTKRRHDGKEPAQAGPSWPAPPVTSGGASSPPSPSSGDGAAPGGEPREAPADTLSPSLDDGGAPANAPPRPAVQAELLDDAAAGWALTPPTLEPPPPPQARPDPRQLTLAIDAIEKTNPVLAAIIRRGEDDFQ